MTLHRHIAALIAFAVVAMLALAAPVGAQSDDGALRALIARFATIKGYAETGRLVGEIATTGDERAARVLRALADGDLHVRKGDGTVVIATGSGATLRLDDPVTGEALGEAGKGDLDKVKVNNSLRRTVRDALGGLNLAAPDPARRLRAAATLTATPDPEALDAIEAALARETDPAVAARLEEARAASLVLSDRPAEQRLDGLRRIGAIGSRDALALLNRVAATPDLPPELRAAAGEEIAAIEDRLRLWGVAQDLWYGLSLGSVLFLAAIGLAITFGVMGVINMAHGEMVMLGAYTTFAVQEVIRTSAPGLFDLSLLIALPLAFLVSGFVGLVMERGIIRHLYGRPLETLLATWGVSLILQQGVRTLFGPNNREVGNPSWMSGSVEFGGLDLTWNRVWIVVFSLVVFALLMLVLRRTSFGLRMRAVTQNRRMAASVGIRTPWVDAFTFALGSGIAGIAGVALSQIGNVSPNLGQSYIIDSFLVVVFGGVGNLWGTLVGAIGLGVVNKLLEPFAGAVLGKILVLVAVILFIQRRPRGLFALRGRAVDA